MVSPSGVTDRRQEFDSETIDPHALDVDDLGHDASRSFVCNPFARTLGCRKAPLAAGPCPADSMVAGAGFNLRPSGYEPGELPDLAYPPVPSGTAEVGFRASDVPVCTTCRPANTGPRCRRSGGPGRFRDASARTTLNRSLVMELRESRQ